MSSNELFGTQGGNAFTGEYNQLVAIIESVTQGMHTAMIVRVERCTNSGDLSPVGFVDVKPLVNQIDGESKAIPPGVIHHLPYTRIQGGSNAIIIDPQPGDMGIAVFAERDISSVKANKAQSNPGSYRRFDWGDGLYIGGVLNGTPNQYVKFSSSGINLHSPTAIDLTAPTVTLNGGESVTVNTPTFTVNGDAVINGAFSQGGGSSGGDATFGGSVTAAGDVKGEGTSLHDHTHSDPQGGNTGAPN